MSKHTLGPWHHGWPDRSEGIRGLTGPGHGFAVLWDDIWQHAEPIWGGDGETVCVISKSDVRGLNVANAHLIAAAPIGYELASEILRACDRSTGRQIDDVTRREIEPLRKLAEKFMAVAEQG